MGAGVDLEGFHLENCYRESCCWGPLLAKSPWVVEEAFAGVVVVAAAVVVGFGFAVPLATFGALTWFAVVQAGASYRSSVPIIAGAVAVGLLLVRAGIIYVLLM